MTVVERIYEVISQCMLRNIRKCKERCRETFVYRQPQTHTILHVVRRDFNTHQILHTLHPTEKNKTSDISTRVHHMRTANFLFVEVNKLNG